MNTDEGQAACCEKCGSFVIQMRAFDGARYYIPVAPHKLQEILGARRDIDIFIFERLQRAEKIITDLRAEIMELKCDPSKTSTAK